MFCKKNEEEYFLIVPYWEKDRAKQIYGYRWDARKKCWVYPKSEETYDALMQEFRQEFRGLIPRRPTLRKEVIKEDESEINLENLGITREGLEVLHAVLEKKIGIQYIDKLEDVIETVVMFLEGGGYSKELEYSPVQVPEGPLILRAALYLERLLEICKDCCYAYDALQSIEKPDDILEYIGQLAKKISGANFFLETAQRIKRSAYEIVDLDRKMEEELRKLAKADSKSSFHEVLEKARDMDILGREGYSLAMTVKNARNAVVHKRFSDLLEDVPRSIIALLAASLLWRSLGLGEIED